MKAADSSADHDVVRGCSWGLLVDGGVSKDGTAEVDETGGGGRGAVWKEVVEEGGARFRGGVGLSLIGGELGCDGGQDEGVVRS